MKRLLTRLRADIAKLAS